MAKFKKTCNRGCGKQIELSNDSGTWVPYNMDGTIHDCEGKLKDKESQSELSKQNEQKIKSNGNGYVDHTIQGKDKGIPQFIIFTAKSGAELMREGNGWLKEKASKINFRGGQFQLYGQALPENQTFSICLWYEDKDN